MISGGISNEPQLRHWKIIVAAAVLGFWLWRLRGCFVDSFYVKELPLASPRCVEVSPSIKRAQELQGGVRPEMGSIHVAETTPGARKLLIKLSNDDAAWIILNLETGQARQVAAPAQPVKFRYDSDKESGCIREGDRCTMLPFDVGGGGFTRISWDGQFVATGTFEATTAPGGFFPSWESLLRSHTGTFSINAYLIKAGPSAPPVVRLSGGWTGRGRDNPWDGLVWVDGRRFIVPVDIHTFRFLLCDVLKGSE